MSSVKRESVGNTRLLPHVKILVVLIIFFSLTGRLCRLFYVDYFLESRAKFPKVQSALPRSGSVLWLVSLLFDLTHGQSRFFFRLLPALWLSRFHVSFHSIKYHFTFYYSRTSIIWTFRLSGLLHVSLVPFFSWISITCDLVIIRYCIIYLIIYLRVIKWLKPLNSAQNTF